MTGRLSLKWSLPLMLATLSLMVGVFSLMEIVDKREGQVTSQAIGDGLSYANHMARMAEQGLSTNTSLVLGDMAQVATDPRVQVVLILDETGRILAAQRYAWRGRLVNTVIPSFDDVWRVAVSNARLPQYRTSANRGRLEVMHPFDLPAKPGEVRSTRRGVAFVDFDLHDAYAEARYDILINLVPDMLAGLMALIYLGWILHRQVTGPVGRLARAVDALRQGDLNTRVAVKGPREIAELGSSFNAMAEAMQHARAALAASENRLAITLHSIGDGLIATDAEGRITMLNPVAETLTGWTTAAAQGHPIGEVFVIENSRIGESPWTSVDQVLKQGATACPAGHVVLLARDGSRHPIAESAAPIRDANGRVQGMVLVFRDETEQYALRRALADSEQHFRTLANSGLALIWTSRPDNKCDWFNEPWLRFTGHTMAQEVGDGWMDAVHGDDRAQCAQVRGEAFGQREPYTLQYRLRLADGEYRWIVELGSPRFDSEGDFLGYVGHCMDITETKQAESAIQHLAFHDALTDLPNRALLLDRLGQALSASRRSERFGAIMFVDLDQFKHINDLYGHAKGDAVLKEVAERLRYYLRQGDTVARLGGDEFVVLIPELSADAGAAMRLAISVAEKIRVALEVPIHIDGQDYRTTSSIGITLFPKEHEGVEDLMREADIAMYQAKESGRNLTVCFERGMQEMVAERYNLEHALREALQQEAFVLFMQSQVDADGKVIGAEALVRWHHPERGMVLPSTFIPVAEEAGLIVALGEWVLRECCQLIARLDALGHGMRIAVNVSPRQFRLVNFVTRVQDILAATGADPTRLTLEITENLLVEHASEAVARMTELTTLGIRFSIDDFGTGYSSLGYLKRLPLYEIKIDKGFVQDVPQDDSDAALVETILAMADHMGFEVVAEGVENAAQLAFLKDRGCNRFQGYHFHRPQPVAAWLDQWL